MSDIYEEPVYGAHRPEHFENSYDSASWTVHVFFLCRGFRKTDLFWMTGTRVMYRLFSDVGDKFIY